MAGFSQNKATGTSLAVILLPVGLGAVFEYYRAGNVDFRAALAVALGLFVAAWIAGHWANRVSDYHLKMAFGIFAMAMGAYITLTTYLKK